MENQITIIQVTPEQLDQVVQNAIKIQLEEFKKSLEPQKTDELVTKEDVKNYLKASYSTLWRWDKEGKLKPFKVKNKVYYKMADIENALKLVKNK